MDALVLGLSLGLGAGLAPGPLLVLVVGATLRSGFAAGVRVAAAPLVSDAPIVVLCVLVLREVPGDVLAVLSIAGALFVARLAWEALQDDGGSAAPAGGGDLRRAVLVNALSPHPWLFWVAVGGPLLVDAGNRSPGLAVAFVAGFYATLVGAKVALAGVAAAGRARGAGRFVPGRVAARAATLPVLRRFGTVRLVSAVLLAAAAIVLLADAVSRLTAS